MEDLLDVSKVMVGVRAAVTVLLTKLPAAKNVRSKSATVRETKRLIKSLKCKAFPAGINAMLDDAAGA